MSDGKFLLNYIKSTLKVGKIGIHGESIGGSFAPSLALSCNADFLFCDRTFTSLGKTVLYGFGFIPFIIFKIFGSRDYSIVKDFVDCKCYKLISSDPDDTMINDLA